MKITLIVSFLLRTIVGLTAQSTSGVSYLNTDGAETVANSGAQLCFTISDKNGAYVFHNDKTYTLEMYYCNNNTGDKVYEIKYYKEAVVNGENNSTFISNSVVSRHDGSSRMNKNDSGQVVSLTMSFVTASGTYAIGTKLTINAVVYSFPERRWDMYDDEVEWTTTMTVTTFNGVVAESLEETPSQSTQQQTGHGGNDIGTKSTINAVLYSLSEPQGMQDAIISTQPSSSPTSHPTTKPTSRPTSHPSYLPTSHPTSYPTSIPTSHPTSYPSSIPTSRPTIPTSVPTSHPTSHPTSYPTSIPTSRPTIPTSAPTSRPTSHPTSYPTSIPTSHPTSYPTSIPTSHPTSYPTSIPTSHPTSYPTSIPTSRPTIPTSEPTSRPTSSPTSRPTSHPTSEPTTPTGQPSRQPTSLPTRQPSSCPTNPTGQPSSFPSRPSNQPTRQVYPIIVIHFPNFLPLFVLISIDFVFVFCSLHDNPRGNQQQNQVARLHSLRDNHHINQQDRYI